MFGTHWVKGEQRGSAIDIYKIYESETSSDSFYLDGSMSLEGTLHGVKADGTVIGNIDKKEESKDEKVTVKVKLQGLDTNATKNYNVSTSMSVE